MYEFECENLNLNQIADSGQCFRWKEIFSDFENCKFHYQVPVEKKLLNIYQEKNKIQIDCTKDEFDSLWKNYLDLNTDYKKIILQIDNDEYLSSAINYGYGIRILNQDLWEMIISFIISQNNNIPRIKKSIEGLCNIFSDVEFSNGQKSFPTCEQIISCGNKNQVLEKLNSIGLGYRDEYIYLMCLYTKENPNWINELKQMNYEQAFEKLISFKGIGKKVANCICLFGLHLINACPVDTWVQKIIDTRYNGTMPQWMKNNFAGIYQQYAFYYERFLSKK